MKPGLRGTLMGAALSLPAIALGAWLPYYLAVSFFAVLLGVTAGVYLGFALQDGRRLVILAETVLLLPFMLLTMAALNLDVHLLALGFFLHGLWDLAHHPRAVQTRLVPWYPPAHLPCVRLDRRRLHFLPLALTVINRTFGLHSSAGIQSRTCLRINGCGCCPPCR